MAEFDERARQFLATSLPEESSESSQESTFYDFNALNDGIKRPMKVLKISRPAKAATV